MSMNELLIQSNAVLLNNTVIILLVLVFSISDFDALFFEFCKKISGNNKVNHRLFEPEPKKKDLQGSASYLSRSPESWSADEEMGEVFNRGYIHCF